MGLTDLKDIRNLKGLKAHTAKLQIISKLQAYSGSPRLATGT